MFVIHHICSKDIYMLYKLYVTYICCVILNNIQIHFKASKTYKHIHQSIFFGHLLLRMHYLMAPPGLYPEEGSQRFVSFLVGLLVFRFRAVIFKPKLHVSCPKCMYVSKCVYVPTVRLVQVVYSYFLFVSSSS